jgi:hypothetical protein
MTLSNAFNDSRLARHGYTLERALQCPVVAWSMAHQVAAAHRTHQVAASLKHQVAAAHRTHGIEDTIYCSCSRSWSTDENPPEGCMK